MGFAQIELFKTEKEAIMYVKKQTEWEKERLFIFYEPKDYPDKPYTVNVD